MSRRTRQIAAGLALLAGSFVLVALSLCDVLIVRGSSMERTFRDGDRVLVVRADVISVVPGLLRRLLAKGRIVAFRSPLRADDLFIKRIVASEGDTVRIAENGNLLVNDRVESVAPTVLPFDVAWPPPRGGQAGRGVVVPRGQYFVLSDNRLQALDSRAFGALSPGSIVGIVVSAIGSAPARPPAPAALQLPRN